SDGSRPAEPFSTGSATPAAIRTAGGPRSMRDPLVGQIVRAYDDPIVRAYCWGRFGILRQRFLQEIGQYLPAEGLVLDVGCGFGLFSLYYASLEAGRQVQGIDVDRRRIGIARRAAVR